MFILTYNISFEELDEKIELLQINDIYNVYYESPLEITTEEYGYGYLEKEVSSIDIKIAFDEDKSNLNLFIDKVNSLLNRTYISLEEVVADYEKYDFPTVYINDSWVLASPDTTIDEKYINKILFLKVLLEQAFMKLLKIY